MIDLSLYNHYCFYHSTSSISPSSHPHTRTLSNIHRHTLTHSSSGMSSTGCSMKPQRWWGSTSSNWRQCVASSEPLTSTSSSTLYTCNAAQVPEVIKLAKKALGEGKCVVIGLQSTGEARTLEQLERNAGELTGFISTAKWVQCPMTWCGAYR